MQIASCARHLRIVRQAEAWRSCAADKMLNIFLLQTSGMAETRVVSFPFDLLRWDVSGRSRGRKTNYRVSMTWNKNNLTLLSNNLI